MSDCPGDGEGDITLTSLTSPQFCACLKPNPRFPRRVVVVTSVFGSLIIDTVGVRIVVVG
jgi:hypothetical protein